MPTQSLQRSLQLCASLIWSVYELAAALCGENRQGTDTLSIGETAISSCFHVLHWHLLCGVSRVCGVSALGCLHCKERRAAKAGDFVDFHPLLHLQFVACAFAANRARVPPFMYDHGRQVTSGNTVYSSLQHGLLTASNSGGWSQDNSGIYTQRQAQVVALSASCCMRNRGSACSRRQRQY